MAKLARVKKCIELSREGKGRRRNVERVEMKRTGVEEDEKSKGNRLLCLTQNIDGGITVLISRDIL